MLNPCASVRFVSYKCQQGVFHHFGAELPSNTSLEVQSNPVPKKNDSCGCFTRHSPAFWNLEKSCVENTLISNATRPTWDQSHGPQLPRGISETSQGKALKMAFWRSTNSISKPVSSSWLRGLPEGHTPPINWGKMIHPPGDVSTTGPN